jgi:hypothetical protein
MNAISIIPNDCHQPILRNADVLDLLNCEVVCRLWKACIDQLKKVDIHFAKEFNDAKKISQYDERLIAAFGGIQNIKNLPFIPFNGEKDNFGNFKLEPYMMGNEPIMRSRNQWGQDFLFFNLHSGARTVLTIFQRQFHTSPDELIEGWDARCWCIFGNDFSNNGYPLEDKNFQAINDLIKNKSIEVFIHENIKSRVFEFHASVLKNWGLS